MPNPILNTINIDGVTYDIADTQARAIDPSMYIASYGNTTFAEVLDAYVNRKIVYCKASSNSNPGTGDQGRMAFLAYVNNPSDPTEFEFQYYRSVSSHTGTQQGDQVFVYKLNRSSGWSVTIREAYTKLIAGDGLNFTFTTGIAATNTIKVTNPLPAVTSADNGKILKVVDGVWTAVTP